MTTPERPEKRCRAAPPPPPDIPEDLLLSDVLPRLPVKSLVRSKCVCRSWRAAVERDPALVRRHLALSRAAPPSKLVVPLKRFYDDDEDDEPKEISFHRLILGNTTTAPGVQLVFRKGWPEGVRRGGAVPSHCDGLIAVAATGDRVLVCNPATRELVVLPPASRDAHDDCSPPPVALGFDPRRNRYVVARCFYRKCYVHEDVASGEDWLVHYDMGHETFTLGGGVCSGWELTADPPHAVARATRPVCTAEAFYWCTAAVGVVQRPSKLLRFGLRDRAFEALPFPPGADFVGGADHLTELASMPCYVRPATDTAFEFWVLAGGGDGKPRMEWEWSLRCRVDFGGYGKFVGEEAMVVVAAAGDQMVIAADHRELYVYDARRGSVRRVVDMEVELEYGGRPEGSTCEYRGDLLMHHVVPYVESLVSIGTCNY